MGRLLVASTEALKFDYASYLIVCAIICAILSLFDENIIFDQAKLLMFYNIQRAY